MDHDESAAFWEISELVEDTESVANEALFGSATSKTGFGMQTKTVLRMPRAQTQQRRWKQTALPSQGTSRAPTRQQRRLLAELLDWKGQLAPQRPGTARGRLLLCRKVSRRESGRWKPSWMKTENPFVNQIGLIIEQIPLK